MRIEATDNAVNQRSATALLIVNVRRNFNVPRFTAGSSTISYLIREDFGAGIPFLTLSATDADNQAPNNLTSFRFLPTSEGQDYFQIDETTGDISVKQSLMGTGVLNQYQVRFQLYLNYG